MTTTQTPQELAAALLAQIDAALPTIRNTAEGVLAMTTLHALRGQVKRCMARLLTAEQYMLIEDMYSDGALRKREHDLAVADLQGLAAELEALNG